MGKSSLVWKIGGKLLRKFAKPIPIIGTAVVVATAYSVLKRKGMLRGGLDVALDAVPVVGTAKGVLELVTGDLISDRVDGDAKVQRGA